MQIIEIVEMVAKALVPITFKVEDTLTKLLE